MASTSGKSWVTSWRLAAVSSAVSGMPRASVRMWCFDPALRRSVGFGPVFFPRAAPAPRHCRRGPASDPVGPAGVIRPAGPRAVGARHRRVATAPIVANRCCPSHSPFPSGAFATATHSARRTGCRSTRPDRGRAVGPWSSTGVAAASGEVARSGSTGRRRSDAGTCVTASVAVTRPYQFGRFSTRGTLATFEMHSKNLRIYRGWSRVRVGAVLFIVILAADATPVRAQSAPADDILARATAYVEQFIVRFSNVVAEERYLQESQKPPRTTGSGFSQTFVPSTPDRVELRSDFLLVRVSEAGDWSAFR